MNLPAVPEDRPPVPPPVVPMPNLPPLPAMFADLPPSQAGDDLRRQAYTAWGAAAYQDWLALCAGGRQCTVCWQWFSPATLPQHRSREHGLLQRATAWFRSIG